MNQIVHMAILKCIDDQQDWFKYPDSNPFSVYNTKQASTDTSLMIMMMMKMVYGYEPMVPFQLMNMEKLPIEVPV